MHYSIKSQVIFINRDLFATFKKDCCKKILSLNFQLTQKMQKILD